MVKKMDDKKKNILDAALTLFTEKGYKETSIQDIAKKSGYACGTIYNYFENKKELFDSINRPELNDKRPNYENKKNEILQNALALFGEKGYKVTSMDNIAEACGISKAMLYHYFKSKKVLFLEIFTFVDIIPDFKHILFQDEEKNIESILAEAGAYYLKTIIQPHYLHSMRILISEGNSFPELKKTSSRGINTFIFELTAFF